MLRKIAILVTVLLVSMLMVALASPAFAAVNKGDVNGLASADQSAGGTFSNDTQKNIMDVQSNPSNLQKGVMAQQGINTNLQNALVGNTKGFLGL